MKLFEILKFEFKRAFVDFKSFLKQNKVNADSSIRFYNWWNDSHGIWLRDFVIQHDILPKNKIMNFCSVYGHRNVLYYIKEGSLIFFNLENLHDDRMEYADHLLFSRYRTDKFQEVKVKSKKCDTLSKPMLVDLALGFDYFEDVSYLRFPLWLLYMFPADSDEKAIRKRCEQLRYPDLKDKSKFASLVARYDWNGTRTEIIDALSSIGQVNCPGKVRHNDDTLKSIYHDDKELYLRQFFFNICPENSNSYGYVTEKIFEAISAGCIPIYWGSYNNPEPGILNKDAIFFWNMDGDNSAVVKQIEELYSHPAMLEEYIRQPRLLPNAEDSIVNMIYELEVKLRRAVQNAYK